MQKTDRASKLPGTQPGTQSHDVDRPARLDQEGSLKGVLRVIGIMKNSAQT